MLGRAIAFAIALASSGALAQSPTRPVAFDSEEATARAAGMRAEIAAELAGSTQAGWAGSYYEGDGLGANIRLELAPATGFVVTDRSPGSLWRVNWSSAPLGPIEMSVSSFHSLPFRRPAGTCLGAAGSGLETPRRKSFPRCPCDPAGARSRSPRDAR